MQYYYIIKDGQIEGRTADRKQAINMIIDFQKLENHYLLKSEYSIIKGEEEEFIKYRKE